jgi:MFS family permease
VTRGVPTKNTASVLAEAVATRDLCAFQLGCAASALALWGFTVALAVAAYQAGGTTAVGVAVLIRTLPSASVAPIIAWLGDRRSRRSSIVIGAATSGALLAGLALVVGAHAPLGAVFVVSALYAIVGTGTRLTQAAMLPNLTHGPRQLASANSVWSALENGGFLVGALLVGLAVSIGSVELAFALLAAAAAVAAVAFMVIAPDPPPAHRVPLPGSTAARELLLGAREIVADPKLRDAVGLLGALTLVDGLVDVLLVVVALRLVAIGAGGVGWLNGAWGAGGLIGGLGGLVLLGRGRFGVAVFTGAVMVAVPMVLLAGLAGQATAVAAFIVFGAGYSIAESASQTLIQRLASDEVMGRAFGVVEALSLVGTGLGAIAAPGLVDALGIRGALVCAGALLPLLILARAGRVRRLDTEAAVPLRELALLRSLDIFAPLPLATVETLAMRASTLAVPAGEAIIRRGEIGDRFYAILEGEVAVLRPDGSTVFEYAGDYFGEIALLHDVPRTTDVTARTDCLLLSLSGEVFLIAVTRHVRSNLAAQAVARKRRRRG